MLSAVCEQVFRLLGCVITTVWCWALSLYVWGSARVNALYVFELAPHSVPRYPEVSARALPTPTNKVAPTGDTSGVTSHIWLFRSVCHVQQSSNQGVP